MAYVLAGLIAPTSARAGLGPATELAPLRQEFVIRSLAHRFLIDGTSLPTDISAAAAYASLQARVVYVEAEFFGGTGAQASLGWDDGHLALGPLRTQTPGEGFDGFEEVQEIGDWAINRALTWLGVRDDDAIDAFDAVGLAARRDWHPRERGG